VLWEIYHNGENASESGPGNGKKTKNKKKKELRIPFLSCTHHIASAQGPTWGK